MAKSRSKSQEGHYAKYKSSGRWALNRARKIERTIKAQPNNEQAKAALKDSGKPRSAPLVSKWSHTAIQTAKLFAEFKKKIPGQVIAQMPKMPFSLGARVVWK